MILDLKNTYEVQKARKKLEGWIEKGVTIDMKQKRVSRTLDQNKYLHVCIGLFGVELGYTLAEAKTLLKRECDFMVYDKADKDGAYSRFLRSTASLSKDECREFIDWIRNYASWNGCYLPSSEEFLEKQLYFERELDKNKQYL